MLYGPWLEPDRMASWAAVDGVRLVRRLIGPWEPCEPLESGEPATGGAGGADTQGSAGP